MSDGSEKYVPYGIAALVAIGYLVHVLQHRGDPASQASAQLPTTDNVAFETIEAPPVVEAPAVVVDAGVPPRPPVVVATPPRPTAPVVPRMTGSAHRVVLVSVDGMHVKLLDVMPTVTKMFADGAGTLKAEVPAGHTTSISHAALFTGAEPGVSGVDCEPDESRCKQKFAYRNGSYHGVGFRWVPLRVKHTLFSVVRATGFKPVAAVQKGKLVGLLREDGDETGIISTNDATELVKTACAAVKDDKVRLVILHFKMIDHEGHMNGWLSDPQKKEAALIDTQLKTVRDCIDASNASGTIDTTLIVTADHGGTPGASHTGSANDNDDNLLVPWVAVGPRIKRGYVIKDRAGLAPTKAGTRPTMLLLDTVPTTLHLLGLAEGWIPTLSKNAKAVDEIFSP